ncbi:unnamed protein product [Allacma fusca]|uniref:G-protein coupled receptors family 1 profile domain-containing protein n=1 Tax=Allacma fusca TaxID=39272 RepID=A0A8J2L478_9HEXA|nr:unnamed protein product [Allacma fusca]
MSSEIDMDYYIFDDPKVQSILLALYSLVFIFCFFGNLTVVLVMAIHWRMQSITKYCIGNLAFANMCVGIFCVYQNFTLFIMGSWPFGNFLCKMFHFVNGLSHTASILILVVISVERYFVVLHPFKCRRILTIKRLRFIMLGVWLLSGILNLPRILYVVLIRNPRVSDNGEVSEDIICSIGSHLFPSETMEMIQFLLLFILPLMVISVLYYKIGMFLHQREAFSQAFVSASLFEYENELSEQSTQTQMSSENLPRTSRKAFIKPSLRIENNEREESNLEWCEETQNNQINPTQIEEKKIEFLEKDERNQLLENPGIKTLDSQIETKCEEKISLKKNKPMKIDRQSEEHFMGNNKATPLLKTNRNHWWGKISVKRLRFLRRTSPGRRFWRLKKPKGMKCQIKCSNCRQHLHQHKIRGQCCYLTKPETFKHGMRRLNGLTSKGVLFVAKTVVSCAITPS